MPRQWFRILSRPLDYSNRLRHLRAIRRDFVNNYVVFDIARMIRECTAREYWKDETIAIKFVYGRPKSFIWTIVAVSNLVRNYMRMHVCAEVTIQGENIVIYNRAAIYNTASVR